MAAPYNPPVKNQDFITYISLPSATNADSFLVNPTLAAGDFNISADDGSLGALGTTPTVTPAGGRLVKVTFSASEMNCNNLKFQAIDLTVPALWLPVAFCIPTVGGGFNPPVKATALTLYVALASIASLGFQANPTIATSDWKISKDGGSFNDLGTNPSVSPASSIWLKIVLTGGASGETDCDVISIQGVDQTAPKQWADFILSIPTVAAS